MKQDNEGWVAQAWAGGVLGAGMLVLLALYHLANGLTWQFDDLINLKDLSGASTWNGMLNFVFGGVAGPTGRPISLATFLADYGAWPDNPWALVRQNLTWHLMNAGLVFILFRALLSTRREWRDRRTVLAACIAVVWMLMPIHASGILMPIQRMTLISGFFVLATLGAFAHLRLRYAGRGGGAPIILIVGACGVGLVLATYSKESGVLLLALVPVVEWSFFRESRPPGPGTIWRIGLWLAFLVVPVFLLWQLISAWEGIQQSFLYYRGYSLDERLATQVVILWEYLRQIALPRAALLGPYHDGHVVHSWGQLLPWLALLGWVVLITVLWRLTRSGSEFVRIVLFAVIFYLSAHVLESTVIPLELYFEHRNYVAALGIAVVAVLGVHELHRRYTRGLAVVGLAVLLAGYQLFALQQATSLWGNPVLAGELWYRMQPDSTRAAQFLAWVYQLQGNSGASLRTLDDFSLRRLDDVGVRIQSMTLACSIEAPADRGRRFRQLQEAIPLMKRPAGITTALASLGKAIRDGECDGVGGAEYEGFLLALLDHPSVTHTPRVRHHVYSELAQMAEISGRNEQRIEYLENAFHDYPSLSGAQIVALLMFQDGRNAEAISWIDQAILHAPNSVAGVSWRNTLASLREAIEHVDTLISADQMEFLGESFDQ